MIVDWDKIYASRGLYSGHGSRGRCAELKIRAITAAIRRLRPASVLDVGCGDLHVVRQVAWGDIAYTGLDNSSVLIDGLGETPPNFDLLLGDFLSMPIRRTWELAICLDVLIHVQDGDEYRRFADRLLAVAQQGLLVSGFARPTRNNLSSSVVAFHESIFETFRGHECVPLGEYHEASMLLVLPGKQRRQSPVRSAAAPTPRRIWTYWETPRGGARPAYLDLCERTWHRHCGDDFEIVRVTDETVDEHAPGLPEAWRRIPCLAHKADYLRAVLVHRHGGLWLDNDVIVLQSLRQMTDRLDQSGSDFIGCGRAGDRPSIGIFGGKPGSLLLAKYIAAMGAFIESRSGDLKFRWTELGYKLLWPLAHDYDYFHYEFRICMPVHPSRFRIFFECRPLSTLSADDCDLRDDTLAACLYNAMFPASFKAMTCEEILDSPMVISQLFRRALGMPAEERT